MAEELEQQLTEFLLNNHMYGDQFAGDLINLFKCHSGEYVKKNIGSYIYSDYSHNYYSMTDNFAVFLNVSVNSYNLYIIHKSRKMNIFRLYGRSLLTKFYMSDIEELREDFNDDRLGEFMRKICNEESCERVYRVNVEWLFTRIPTKSARN